MTLSAELSLVVLFGRLTWPSGMVRERAAYAISCLMQDEMTSHETREFLWNWLGQQRLESLAAVGLLPLARAVDLSPALRPACGEKAVKASIAKSLLSWHLLNATFPDSELTIGASLVHSGSPPLRQAIDPFFMEYIKSFLPPIYFSLARTLERKLEFPFIRQWGYEWETLLKALGYEPSLKPVNYWFRGKQEGRRYVAVDTKMSEVYRSSFLRTLAWGVSEGLIGKKEAGYHACRTCPIDLGLWRIAPISKPTWWPSVDHTATVVDETPGIVWSSVDGLWDQHMHEGIELNGVGWSIVEASGTVSLGETICELEIHGVFQRCHGPSEPELGELSSWYLDGDPDRPNRVQPSLTSCLELAGSVQPQPLANGVQHFHDWSIIAASGLVRGMAVPRWQWWRMYRDVWLPSPFLIEDEYEFECTEDGLIAASTGEVMARWRDWTDGVSETTIDDVPPPGGQALLISREVIDDFADRTNSRFAWICTLTSYYRKHSYEKYEEFKDHREYGATRIIFT